MGISDVPCKACKLCCQGHQVIFLFPEKGDDISNYRTTEIYNPINGRDQLALQFKENGDCTYINEKGCEIYKNRPVICKSYDCRKQYLLYPKKLRKEIMHKPLYNAAKERINTLPQSERKELRLKAQLKL